MTPQGGVVDPGLVASIIWFAIGFGAGMFVIRFWAVVLAAIIVALIAPLILAPLGVTLSPELVIGTAVGGVEWFARFLVSRAPMFAGFIVGLVLSLFLKFLRG
ncbi:MAG: hypothetical protein NZ953_01220 [Thaumarchaeota archaeon]|nr:hypothetical protein [Candidatus Calditenuaceae archaeon]MDW8043125.1 hypothetical protein [Nitrososphaerota archaeon]